MYPKEMKGIDLVQDWV